MKGIKFAIGLAFLLSAVSLAGSWFLFERLKVAEVDREQWESLQDDLKEQNASLETQVTQYQEETRRLREQMEGYVEQRDSLKTELDQADAEIGRLRKQIKQLDLDKVELAKRVDTFEVTEKAVQKEASKLLPPVLNPEKPAVESLPPQHVKEVKKEEKSKKPEKQETPQKAEKKEKKAEKAPAPPPVQDQRPHQVLSVNRQFNFVVVNVGLRDRLKIGDTLRVEQNGKLIGRIQVEKLYENFSACTILEEVQPAHIGEGDLVRIA